MVRYLLVLFGIFISIACANSKIETSTNGKSETPNIPAVVQEGPVDVSNFTSTPEMLDFVNAASYVAPEFLDTYFNDFTQAVIYGFPVGHMARQYDSIVAAKKVVNADGTSARYLFTMMVCIDIERICSDPQYVMVELPRDKSLNKRVTIEFNYSPSNTNRAGPLQLTGARIPNGYPVSNGFNVIEASRETLDVLNAMTFFPRQINSYFVSASNRKYQEKPFERITEIQKVTDDLGVTFHFTSEICEPSGCRDPQTISAQFPMGDELSSRARAYLTVSYSLQKGTRSPERVYVNRDRSFPWWYFIGGPHMWQSMDGIWIF